MKKELEKAKALANEDRVAVDAENLKLMREVWEAQVSTEAKVKQLLAKHQTAASKEAASALGKKFPKSAVKEAFQNSELFKQLQSHLGSMIALNMAMADQIKIEVDMTAKVDALN